MHLFNNSPDTLYSTLKRQPRATIESTALPLGHNYSWVKETSYLVAESMKFGRMKLYLWSMTGTVQITSFNQSGLRYASLPFSTGKTGAYLEKEHRSMQSNVACLIHWVIMSDSSAAGLFKILFLSLKQIYDRKSLTNAYTTWPLQMVNYLVSSIWQW